MLKTNHLTPFGQAAPISHVNWSRRVELPKGLSGERALVTAMQHPTSAGKTRSNSLSARLHISKAAHFAVLGGTLSSSLFRDLLTTKHQDARGGVRLRLLPSSGWRGRGRSLETASGDAARQSVDLHHMG